MEKINWNTWTSSDAQGNLSLEEIAEKICEENGIKPHGMVEVTALKYIMGQLAQRQKAMENMHNDNQEIEQDEDDLSKEHPIRGGKVQAIVQTVIQQGILNELNPVVELFNMTTFRNRTEELVEAFKDVPGVHAMAVKSNPMRGVLSEAKLAGLGAECASYPEAIHSLNLGFEPRKVIYDTPCKPYNELKEMIESGVYINLDNLEEIEKVNRIFEELGPYSMDLEKHQKQIGLRINPVVGGGKIQSTSTATASSKFGLPLTEETAEDLFALYETNPWLQGVHVHVGSQGCALQMLVTGAQRSTEFALSTNKRLGRNQIQVIDIGGGMPTKYDGIGEAYSYSDYVKELKQSIPALFSGEFQILTEFGRSLCVKSGITISKVEAVKTWCNQRQAVIHVGANQFLRTAYLPDQWKHSLSVFTSTGELKTGPYLKHDIAGPMCFSGDYLAKKVLLPEIEAGDYLVIHDTGGYTSAMYSKYNSRRSIALYAYTDTLKLSLLKARETCEETLKFWGSTADSSPSSSS